MPKNISVIRVPQKKLWNEDAWRYGYDFDVVQNGKIIYSGDGSDEEIMSAVRSIQYSETDSTPDSEMVWH